MACETRQFMLDKGRGLSRKNLQRFAVCAPSACVTYKTTVCVLPLPIFNAFLPLMKEAKGHGTTPLIPNSKLYLAWPWPPGAHLNLPVY